MSVKKNIRVFAENADKTILRIDKLELRTQQLKQNVNLVRKIGIPLGLLGIAADCYYHGTFSPSWASIMGTFTGVTVYLVCKEMIKEDQRRVGKKLNHLIETFDEDFAGFKVIAMFIMENLLENSEQLHKEIFRNYIINIHNSHEKLMEIKTTMNPLEMSTRIQETKSKFETLRQNFRNMLTSYENVERSNL